jgi:glycosyltransferase involved in cell wall biosynthesis
MNGIDRESCFAPATGSGIRKQYGLEGKFVCSYIGTVGLACGLEVVLRAAAALKNRANHDVIFLIVGTGATQGQLKEAARKDGLENVIFAGRHPKAAMPEFLAASDACLVHLKKRELFRSVMPSKIFEALAMSRPVILGVEGAAADFIRRSTSGICMEPENPGDLLLAIERLQRDPALAQSLGRNGRDYVLKHCDWDMLADSYLQQIRGVLDAAK